MRNLLQLVLILLELLFLNFVKNGTKSRKNSISTMFVIINAITFVPEKAVISKILTKIPITTAIKNKIQSPENEVLNCFLQ